MAVTLPLQEPKSGSLLFLLEVSCKKLDSKGSLKTLIGVGWVDNHLKKVRAVRSFSFSGRETMQS